jgi:hypothetical protein
MTITTTTTKTTEEEETQATVTSKIKTVVVDEDRAIPRMAQ